MLIVIFVKEGLVSELLVETCKGGRSDFFSVLASYLSSNLKGFLNSAVTSSPVFCNFFIWTADPKCYVILPAPSLLCKKERVFLRRDKPLVTLVAFQ